MPLPVLVVVHLTVRVRGQVLLEAAPPRGRHAPDAQPLGLVPHRNALHQGIGRLVAVPDPALAAAAAAAAAPPASQGRSRRLAHCAAWELDAEDGEWLERVAPLPAVAAGDGGADGASQHLLEAIRRARRRAGRRGGRSLRCRKGHGRSRQLGGGRRGRGVRRCGCALCQRHACCSRPGKARCRRRCQGWPAGQLEYQATAATTPTPTPTTTTAANAGPGAAISAAN